MAIFTTSAQSKQQNKYKASVVRLPAANCSKQSEKSPRIQHLYRSSYATLQRFQDASCFKRCYRHFSMKTQNLKQTTNQYQVLILLLDKSQQLNQIKG